MLGRRSPQRGLFDVIGLPHPVDPESFYGRMGALAHLLFRDEELAGMYTLDNGRPSLPPSLMCGVLLLQFYDDVSDGEAVERLKFDLRWKVALGLPLDYLGFDPSSLSVFRGGCWITARSVTPSTASSRWGGGLGSFLTR